MKLILNETLGLISRQLRNKIGQWLSERSGRMTESLDKHYLNIINYLKTGSLDYAIREFSLAKPSWYMSHYTMIYKNGERMQDFLALFVFIVV